MKSTENRLMSACILGIFLIAANIIISANALADTHSVASYTFKLQFEAWVNKSDSKTIESGATVKCIVDGVTRSLYSLWYVNNVRIEKQRSYLGNLYYDPTFERQYATTSTVAARIYDGDPDQGGIYKCAYTWTLTVQKPDLIVLSVAGVASSYKIGETIGATTTIGNNGNVAAASSKIKYYLGTSADRTYRFIQNGSIGSLSAGQTENDIIYPYWTIPSDVSPGTYQVWVLADANNDIDESNESNNWGSSASFSICATLGTPSDPSPANGSTITASPTKLNWADVSGATSYGVYLNDTFLANVAASEWPLNQTLAIGTYRWYVIAKSACESKRGPTWSFDVSTPKVTVTSPNGGENWPVGSSQTITAIVTSLGNGVVMYSGWEIYYSTDRGSTWTPIASGLAISNNIIISYPWRVPNTPSPSCRVRVVVTYSGGSASDRSDADFGISQPTGNKYTFRPPFTGATQMHTDNEGSAIWGRRVGSAPSPYPASTGKIGHLSLVGAYLFGGTNWYVHDEVKFPITVSKSGFYKITFKGRVNGLIAAARVGEIGHCAHYLSVSAGIYGLGSSKVELRNTLDDKWPTALGYISENAARAILSAVFPSGWAAVALEAVEVASTVAGIIDQLQQLRVYANESLGSEGMTIYGNLQQGTTYEAVFWVWSHNVAATSAGQVASLIDVTAQLEELIVEEHSSQPVTVPSSPSLLLPSNNETNIAISPTLSWYSSDEATSYRLQVSNNPNFTSRMFDRSGITNTSQQILALSHDTIYYWRVNASNSAGTSSYSSTRSFRTIPASPVVPTLAAPPDGTTGISSGPSLSWNASIGATAYRLQLSTSPSFSSFSYDIGGITGTSHQVSGLANNTIYYWRVNANNDGGASAWSTAWNFKTGDPTSVELLHSEVPTQFYLEQNYPNPFNPSTRIEFSVPRSTFVTLKVFNLLGEEVCTLATQEFKEGTYTVDWNASGAPSGVYFYRLCGGSFAETRRMLLLK
jgi:hypothetical protein